MGELSIQIHGTEGSLRDGVLMLQYQWEYNFSFIDYRFVSRGPAKMPFLSYALFMLSTVYLSFSLSVFGRRSRTGKCTFILYHYWTRLEFSLRVLPIQDKEGTILTPLFLLECTSVLFFLLIDNFFHWTGSTNFLNFSNGSVYRVNGYKKIAFLNCCYRIPLSPYE